MAITTANHVAQGIIRIALEHENPVSNLKLQKLLYYAQAWHLVFADGQALFDDPIEAWVHGPVVPNVFKKYRDYRWNPITDATEFDELQRPHLEAVWKAYGKFTATQLEQLTHSEAPWREVREGLPIDASSSRIIPNGLIRNFYSSLLNA